VNLSSRGLPVYADTSVFGGLFDAEFEATTRGFFREVQSGRFRLVTSALVQQEIDSAPPDVRASFASFVASAEVVPITEDAIGLRQAYVNAGVVTQKSLADALHVATASVSGCPLIVSWNFRHIVHFQKIPMYNAVNALLGYNSIAIHSPREVLDDEEGV
jgi:predicted nucleic acid-binding protein